jgi:hypothetical protein
MNREFLKDLRAINNNSKMSELLEEGIETIVMELKPVITKLKEVEPDYAVDMLEEYILLMNDLYALSITHLTSIAKSPITCDQALFVANLNQCIAENVKN